MSHRARQKYRVNSKKWSDLNFLTVFFCGGMIINVKQCNDLAETKKETYGTFAEPLWRKDIKQAVSIILFAVNFQYSRWCCGNYVSQTVSSLQMYLKSKVFVGI